MTSPLRNVPLGMDERMLIAGTGVASYAHALRRAQQDIDPGAFILSASGMTSTGGLAGIVRMARAAMPWSRRARRFSDRLVAVDIFRVAQLFFDYHARPLAIRVPGPRGVMHWSYPVPLYLVGWANLYTVHDTIPLSDPGLTPIDPDRHRRLLAAVVARAARLVTVSEAARATIIETLGCAPAMVVDCSQPVQVDDGKATSTLPAPLRAGHYLLVCGSLEPRKNIARIAAAYRASGTKMPLVFAGPDGWRVETLHDAIAGPGIVRLPYLPRAELLALIANARALVMPSLAEGFGLPVAEAMALGVPVLTSRDGALAETAGRAALLVDPLDEAAMALAIRRLTEDDALCRLLAARGKAEASRFTMRGFTARLSALYAGCVAPGGISAYAPSSTARDGS